MTKSKAERLARSYRLMAGRLFMHLTNGTAADSGAEAQIRAAHDKLCEAFFAIEDHHGL